MQRLEPRIKQPIPLVDTQQRRQKQRQEHSTLIQCSLYLDSVDAVKAPVDPVARADELDPIDLLEATE